MIKNVFPEFEGNNWAKIACGNVSSQALSACLAESQFEGCAAQQMLRFQATVLLGSHLFETTGSAADVVATDPLVVWFGRDKKSAMTFFKPGKYNSYTLNSEINAKWRCCLSEMGAGTREMAVTSGL
jgi:hypothetical protein